MSDENNIVFSDLSLCEPGAALSRQRKKNRWRTMSYEADSIKGVLLSAYRQSDPPSVRLRLGVKGNFDILLGLYPEEKVAGIRVKLSSDPCCRELRAIPAKGDCLNEVYWKTSKLDGQDIEIFPLKQVEGDPVSALAYIKLVPVKKKKPMSSDLWLGAFIDGMSFIYYNEPKSEKEIWEQLEPLRDTAFKKIYWGLPPGDMGFSLLDAESWDFYADKILRREGEKRYFECLQKFHNNNLDVIRIVRDYAQKNGLEFHLYHRMGLVTGASPYEMWRSEFYHAHPEWQCTDRDGRLISRLSYVFPGVRQRIIELYKQVVDRYNVDGINFTFHRGVPLLLYEEPVIKGFKNLYGVDPRNVSENDERLFHFRSGIITDFLCEIRETLNSQRISQGRSKLEFTATTLIDKKTNHFYNLDLDSWTKNEVIDVLIPYPQKRDISDNDNLQMSWFSSLTKGKQCQLCPELRNVRAWLGTERHYEEMLTEFNQYDIDGICFWDLDRRFIHPFEWEVIKSLAWPQKIKNNIAKIKRKHQIIPLRTVDNFTVDRYPVWWAF